MATIEPRINLSQLDEDLYRSHEVTIIYVADGEEKIFQHSEPYESVCIELRPHLVVKRCGEEDKPGGWFEVALDVVTKIVMSDSGANPTSFWGTWEGNTLRRFMLEK